jgi:exopolysaccharide biosynthesis polyprenyl glycosylphosphotransferase
MENEGLRPLFIEVCGSRMATPKLWQPSSPSISPVPEWPGNANPRPSRPASVGLIRHASAECGAEFSAVSSEIPSLSASGRRIKRALDIVLSAPTLLLLSPILLVIALAIRLDSPGPVFYVSERVGKNGRLFRCFKFRTMVRDAERQQERMKFLNERDAVLFKISSDPRVTSVGRILRRYSLDELPQFCNVLLGEMSIVGPRPPVAVEVREYSIRHLRRLAVTPGITGLWQIQGRHDPSFESYVSLDLTYIENWSIALDLKIIAQTFSVVLSGTGT